MKRNFLSLAILSALVACGGGGGESIPAPTQLPPPPAQPKPLPDPPAPPVTPPPAAIIEQPPVTPVQPPAANDPPPVIDEEENEPPVTIPSNPDFEAQLVRAPSNGSYICSPTVLYITGKGIKNAELVHGDRYASYARFSTSVDGSFAVLQFDPRTIWNNGAIEVRILAWDQPAGASQAREVVVMPKRTWIISNDAPPCTPAIGSIAK